MIERLSVAYYLSIVGGSFTILTAVGVFTGSFYNVYLYRTPTPAPTYGLLILLPALAVLFFGQKFETKPEKHRQSAFLVIAMSAVSMVGVLGSGAILFIGFLFSGPYLSFAGGVVGMLWHRPNVGPPKNS